MQVKHMQEDKKSCSPSPVTACSRSWLAWSPHCPLRKLGASGARSQQKAPRKVLRMQMQAKVASPNSSFACGSVRPMQPMGGWLKTTSGGPDPSCFSTSDKNFLRLCALPPFPPSGCRDLLVGDPGPTSNFNRTHKVPQSPLPAPLISGLHPGRGDLPSAGLQQWPLASARSQCLWPCSVLLEPLFARESR